MSVTLNIDAGELADEPEALYSLAHAVSIACGGHAGDEASMRLALERCREHGTRAGAHPSFPDRAGFGRKEMAIAVAALQASVEAQCARLATCAREVGLVLDHVKAHGALYHCANRDPHLATVVVEAARAALGDAVAILGPPAGALSEAARAAGLPFLREGFADRGLLPDGTLVPRGRPGALLTDPGAAAAQARRLRDLGGLDTLCVHGDSPGAVAIARAVRAVLDQ